MSFVGNHGNHIKNNKTFIGNHLRVTGNNNTITGNHNTIIGNNNTICGNHCNITGNNNKLTGNHAFINGNNNSAKGSFIRMTGNNNNKSSGNKSSSSYISNFSFGENFGTIGDTINGVTVNYGGMKSPVFNFDSNDDGMGMLSGLFSTLNMDKSSDKKKKDKKNKKKKKQIRKSPLEGDEWLDPSTGKRLIYKGGLWVDILDKDDGSGSSEKNKNSMECVVCMENSRNIIIKPCNHLCCCEECSKIIDDNCPICRTEIEKIEKVYI